MLGLLINIKNNKNIINVLYNKIILSALKVDFYCPNINMLPNNIINSKRKKYPIIAWTINSKEELEKAKKYADSYIFEDNII